MKNPIQEFREANSLTQDQLANYAEVTRQVVTKVEMGLFNYIPPSIMTVLKAYLGAGASEYELKYTEWLDSEVRKINPDALPPVGEGSVVKTFIDWRYRISSSVNGFCTMFKIQPVIISNYEKGQTQHLPEILKERLRTAGCTERYILELERLPHHG